MYVCVFISSISASDGPPCYQFGQIMHAHTHTHIQTKLRTQRPLVSVSFGHYAMSTSVCVCACIGKPLDVVCKQSYAYATLCLYRCMLVCMACHSGIYAVVSVRHLKIYANSFTLIMWALRLVCTYLHPYIHIHM